jgi:hypothetical protein
MATKKCLASQLKSKRGGRAGPRTREPAQGAPYSGELIMDQNEVQHARDMHTSLALARTLQPQCSP